MALELCGYLDKQGVALPAGQGRTAHYKIEALSEGGYVLMEKCKSSWVMAYSGTLKEIELWLQKCKRVKEEPTTPTQQELPESPKEYVHAITKVVMARVSHMPGIDTRQVNNYIYMLLWRNQRSDKNRVINTRWADQYGQPIYLLYTGAFNKPISLRNAHLVDSISQAQTLCSAVTQTRLPDPLQWSEDVSDYFWDPTMEVLGLSDRAMEHIAEERATRLEGPARSLDTQTLIRSIKEALYTGQQRACRDCAYALPGYSRRYNSVGMLLPLHVYTKDSELPEAVMLLSKTVHGYSLVTLITPQQAYISVRAFRDPEMTWLKGAI